MSTWSVEQLAAVHGDFRLGPIDLSVADGETVAIVGRSGAGKTTLLRAIAGFAPVSSGRVVQGTTTVDALPPERRSAVLVPPGLALFPHRTVRQNVAYPLRIAGIEPTADRIDPLLSDFGLGPLADRRPRELSTGEQQRVALARSLAAAPSLLLWDEPLGGLDLLAREELLASLREFRSVSPTPLLLVTHDPALAYALAERWLVLDAGRTVYSGPPGPLVDAPPTTFAARFVGYENVYDRTELRADAGPFSQALLRGAGPAGVALAAPEPSSGGSKFVAQVERIEPSAGVVRILARIEGLRLSLRRPGPFRGEMKPGDRVGFVVEPAALVPIGRAPARPEERS